MISNKQKEAFNAREQKRKDRLFKRFGKPTPQKKVEKVSKKD